MRTVQLMVSGTAGALALNGIHEAARKAFPNAPHVDAIGMRAVGKSLQRVGMAPFSLSRLRKITLVVDLVTGAIYYGLTVAAGKDTQSNKTLFTRALFFGSAVGVAVATLPPVLGLGYQPTRKPAITAALTATWYLSGALVTAAVASLLNRKTA